MGDAVARAADRFCQTQQVPTTSKRLLFEYLAYPGANGKTISGLFAAGVQPDPGLATDLEGITTKFASYHVIKHYFKMRQYNEATGVVRDFLKYLRSEGTLPAAASTQLDAAIQVRAAGSPFGSVPE